MNVDILGQDTLATVMQSVSTAAKGAFATPEVQAAIEKMTPTQKAQYAKIAIATGLPVLPMSNTSGAPALPQKGDYAKYMSYMVIGVAVVVGAIIMVSTTRRRNPGRRRAIHRLPLRLYFKGAGVGGYEYRTVYTDTLKGLKQAERMKNMGWKIIRSGLFSVQFERTKRSYGR